MQKRILVVDDDSMNLVRTKMILGKQYDVILSESGEDALKKLKNETIDLVLLDIAMPEMNGIETFEHMKEIAADIPVIFLTARDMEQDEMRGFDCGADDYITKPFKMPILHRRIQAALRKSGKKETDARYDDGYLKIDFDSLTAVRNGQALVLTPLEYKILRLLTANADKVLTKQLLLEKIWDSSGNFVDEHAVAVNISRLRKKIESEGYSCIKTLYGMGYQWTGGKKARQE